MRFAASVLALGALATTATALQGLFLGTITKSNGGLDNFVWFIDGPACTTGADLGSASTSLCDLGDVTVLGHSGLTFTGCPPPSPYGGGVPTGVSDSGAPSLTCAPAANREIPCGGDINVELLFECQ